MTILNILNIGIGEEKMAYVKDVFDCISSREIEIKYKGRFGAKGEKRAPKQKPTSYLVRKSNQLNKEKEVRRLLKVNFRKNDLWCTLKYKKGYRPDIQTIEKDLRNFFCKLRRKYKKYGQELKYIYRLEVGKYGGVHIHLVVNADIPDADLLVSQSWSCDNNAGVYWARIKEEGGFAALAHYIVKEPDYEVGKQLSLFDYEVRKHFVKYSRSRNLKKPKVDRLEYSRRTVRKIILEGIQASEGYYIDKESIRMGINPFTGMSYIHYTEVKIKIKEDESPPT